MRSVCVFCGASAGRRPEYGAAARHLGGLIGRRRLTLVYGGSAHGLMAEVADAALAAGAPVIGVMPRSLVDLEIAHRGLTELHVVPSLQRRKELMAELADAFVALPGGVGTLDEVTEMWSWTMLGVHRKPCALYDVAGYFERLLAFVDHAVAEGFLRPADRALLAVEDDAERLLDGLAARLR